MKFADFLHSDFCKEILQSNDLKIHIETGNIYYQDIDTNESIFEFIKNQQNISKSVIHIELKFDGSYKSYFQWILNEFDAQQKTDFDIFSNQNTKYLVYLFNDFQNSIGESLIKIRHTLITDNYLAAEEIQNQDWEYSIERVIKVFKFNNPSIRLDEDFLLSTIENVTIAKRVYTMIYNVIARNFSLTISKLSVDEKKDVSDEFLIKIFGIRIV